MIALLLHQLAWPSMANISDLEELKRLERSTLEFRFANGYAVRVRLLVVDPKSPAHELIYEVIEVLDWGAMDPAMVRLKAPQAAAVADLVSWKVLG